MEGHADRSASADSCTTVLFLSHASLLPMNSRGLQELKEKTQTWRAQCVDAANSNARPRCRHSIGRKDLTVPLQIPNSPFLSFLCVGLLSLSFTPSVLNLIF